jgi:hypothetical protein
MATRPELAREFIEYMVTKEKDKATKAGTAFKTPITMLSRHDIAHWLKVRNGGKSWYAGWNDYQRLQEATMILQAARIAGVRFAGIYCLNRKSHGAGTIWEIVREKEAAKMAAQYVGEARDVLYARLEDRVKVAAKSDAKAMAHIERMKESIEYGMELLDRLMAV